MDGVQRLAEVIQMIAQIACWTLSAIFCILSITSIGLALVPSNAELFDMDTYRYLARTLLFLAGIAWLVMMAVVITGAEAVC